MRILFYCSKFPPQAGGGGVKAYHLGEDLSHEGHQIHVVCEHAPGLKKYEQINPNYFVYRVEVPFIQNRASGLYFLILCLGIAFRGIRLIWQKKIDILHCQDTATGIAGLITRFLTCKPTIFKFAGSMTYEYLCNSRKNAWDPAVGERGAWGNPQGVAKYILWIEKQYFKSFDLIYPVAQYLVEMIHQHLNINHDKIRLIHNGVKIETLQRADFPDIKTQLKIRRLIFTGQRFVKYKGLHTLIEACLPILEPMDAHLVIAGFGPEENALKKMANNNPRIFFPGNLPWEDAMRYTRSADAYVLPTLVDKTPNSLMEALALETPCITTDIDGVRELVGPGAGILVPCENTTILREKIIWLLEHPVEASEMGKKGREYIQNNFSWEITREKIKMLYHELLAKKANG